MRFNWTTYGSHPTRLIGLNLSGNRKHVTSYYMHRQNDNESRPKCSRGMLLLCKNFLCSSRARPSLWGANISVAIFWNNRSFVIFFGRVYWSVKCNRTEPVALTQDIISALYDVFLRWLWNLISGRCLLKLSPVLRLLDACNHWETNVVT